MGAVTDPDARRRELTLHTRRRTDLVEITEMLREAVRGSGLERGLLHCFVPHTTAGVVIGERIDPQVGADFAAHLERLVPWSGGWTHPNNAAAHVKASLVGHALVLAVEEGELVLGAWQGVFFCEFHGPRERRIWVTLSPG